MAALSADGLQCHSAFLTYYSCCSTKGGFLTHAAVWLGHLF